MLTVAVGADVLRRVVPSTVIVREHSLVWLAIVVTFAAVNVNVALSAVRVVAFAVTPQPVNARPSLVVVFVSASTPTAAAKSPANVKEAE